MNDDRLILEQLRAGFASLAANATPGSDCPDPDEIWMSLRGELSARPAARIVAHTARCHACAEAWRLGRELGGQPPAASRGVATMFRAPALGVWASLAAAALLLVVAGIGIVWPPASHQPGVTRASAEAEIRSLVPETAPLPRDACLLRWSVPAAGARYTLRVGLEDLTPIASARGLEKPEYQIPAKNLEKAAPGSTIVWRVEADLPDGRRISSQSFTNRIE